MGIVSFPSEARSLASLEKNLYVNLSLQRIEEITQQVMIQSTDKTREVSSRLLERLEMKKEELIEKYIVLLDQTRHPISKIQQLKSLMYFLSPVEVERQIEAIEMEAVSLPDSDRKIQRKVQAEMQHIRFMQEKPILHELNEDVPNNFMRQVLKIAIAVRETKSLDLLQEFNQVQLTEILRTIPKQPEKLKL